MVILQEHTEISLSWNNSWLYFYNLFSSLNEMYELLQPNY